MSPSVRAADCCGAAAGENARAEPQHHSGDVRVCVHLARFVSMLVAQTNNVHLIRNCLLEFCIDVIHNVSCRK